MCYCSYELPRRGVGGDGVPKAVIEADNDGTNTPHPHKPPGPLQL